LELASGLYDSSLATETWKGAEKVLQTDTPSGNTLKLTLTAKPNDRKGICGRRLALLAFKSSLAEITLRTCRN
jgi:hypothetical protein